MNDREMDIHELASQGFSSVQVVNALCLSSTESTAMLMRIQSPGDVCFLAFQKGAKEYEETISTSLIKLTTDQEKAIDAIKLMDQRTRENDYATLAGRLFGVWKQ
jgi:hypothetical protein